MTLLSESSGTRIRLYEFDYRPFGLVNALTTFFIMTKKLLSAIRNVATCIDDMSVYFETFQDHIFKLPKALKRIEENCLTVKLSKIEIGFPEISFLGHTIKQGCIATDYAIVSKILKIEPPKSKKCIQYLVGLMNYYAKFMTCFAGGK